MPDDSIPARCPCSVLMSPVMGDGGQLYDLQAHDHVCRRTMVGAVCGWCIDEGLSYGEIARRRGIFLLPHLLIVQVAPEM